MGGCCVYRNENKQSCAAGVMQCVERVTACHCARWYDHAPV